MTTATRAPATRPRTTAELSLRSGPYPLDRLDALIESGISLFLDLTEVGELQSYTQLLGKRARHVRAAISDFGVPREDEMARALDVIDDALAHGETVYVHCRAGVGRTRTVIGCHGKRHGTDAGPSPETAEQRRFVRSWPAGR